MAYTQTLIDDFNDNSLNTTKWTVVVATAPTDMQETNQRYRIKSSPDYNQLDGKSYFDMTKGFLGFKYYQTGTPTTDMSFFYGLVDSSTHRYVGFSTFPATGGDAANTAAYDTDGSGPTPISYSDVVSPNTVMRQSTWVNGSWVGVGNITKDTVDPTLDVVHFYTSSDAVTWVQVAQVKLQYDTGQTFNITTCGLTAQAGTFGTTSSTWYAEIDDVTYFVPTVGPITKVRVGGAWVVAKPKARVGGAWVVAKPKRRVGGAWV